MIVKIYKFFNQSTRQALLDHVNGYVDKSRSISAEIARIKKRCGVEHIYRFDLGENVDGFSPKIHEFLDNIYKNKGLFDRLNEYPDVTHRSLRQKISQFYNIPREFIIISNGLDSILDLITRVFFEYNDVFLMPVPDFFLFENYSERMGAMPIFLPLDENKNFIWTYNTISELSDLIIRFKPKMVWISNPGNPTGQVISDDVLYEVVRIAHSNNVFVVIDEAYGEYIIDREISAVKYINEFQNLIVLRTFSKAYGLAGIRLGYLMSSSKDVIRALLLHRHHFPATQLALNTAEIALDDQEFIIKTKKLTEDRKFILFSKLKELKSFRFIPSETNIFMLKNIHLTDSGLDKLLKEKGIISSFLRISGVENKNYLRITMRGKKDNEYLYQVCKEIDENINSLIVHKKDNVVLRDT